MGRRSPKGYGSLGWGSPKNLAKTYGNEGLEWAEDAQRNKMGQGSPKQRGNKPNGSTGLQELSKWKVYNRPKRGPASISQMITWQKQ